MARVEKQNPSLSKASVLSHSVQGEGDVDADGVGHATEAEDRGAAVISPNLAEKDGSSYNIATSDITAIPQQ